MWLTKKRQKSTTQQSGIPEHLRLHRVQWLNLYTKEQWRSMADFRSRTGHLQR